MFESRTWSFHIVSSPLCAFPDGFCIKFSSPKQCKEPEAKIFLLDLPEVLQQVTAADGRLHTVFVDLQSDWSQEVHMSLPCRCAVNFLPIGQSRRFCVQGSRWVVLKVPLADLVLLGRVLHDFYDDAAVKILETAHKALKPDGRIAIIESLGSC